MAEATIDLRHQPKDRAYPQLHAMILNVLAGIEDDVAAMATMSSLIHHAFGFLWTGFYRAVGPNHLRVGPYQGTLGCLDIEFGRGVCGTAAAERKTVVVPDVDKFPGHIACDADSRSELVVLLRDAEGAFGVLDLDSPLPGRFDKEDQAGIEKLAAIYVAACEFEDDDGE
jgi:GAF domain-containing protein